MLQNNYSRLMARPSAVSSIGYPEFLHEVRRRHLQHWLRQQSSTPMRVLDLSTGCPALLDVMVAAGHAVVHAGSTLEPGVSGVSGADLRLVAAEPRRLTWVRPASVDAVVAEGSVLSSSLATEITVEDIAVALRPGGRLLLTVDSLTSGLATLAGQSRWAELADLPAADVVLVPAPDGSLTRCFSPDELQAMLDAAGFDVEAVHPRTVLTAETVSAALAGDPHDLTELVSTELRLADERQGESLGAELVAGAVKR
jgi:hypothetical protein